MTNQKSTATQWPQAVWAFNFRPDTYIHASWVDQIPHGNLVNKLILQSRGTGQVVSYLFEQFELQQDTIFNFEGQLSRLALWDGRRLEQLVLYLGAVFYQDTAKQMILREEVAALQQEIGTDVYAFMHRRADAARGKLRVQLEMPNFKHRKKTLVVLGLICLNISLQSQHQALRKRIMLKLPKSWYRLFKQYLVLGENIIQEEQACANIVKKVIIELQMRVGEDGQIHFN